MGELKRVLGFWSVLALSISSIMGTGLFFGVGIGSSYSGPSSIISWIILSIVAIYISMYFAELVSIYPKAGGIYEYSKHAYNHFFSFLIGWIAWVVGNLITALIIVAAIDYIIPDSSRFLLKIIVGFLLVIILNFIAYLGIESSTKLLFVFTIFAIGVLLSIIIPGIFQINVLNYSQFFAFGVSSILVTVFFLAESFFGWEGATYLAEETMEPEKSIPKAIVIGTIIVAVLAVSTAIVSIGVVNWRLLKESASPLSIVAKPLFGKIGTHLLNFGVFISLIGSAASGVITMPRLILSLARDKLFISQLSDVHEKFKTPYKAIIFQTIVSIFVFLIAFGKYKVLLGLLLPLGFIMYLFVILSVPILRIKEPQLKRWFKVPFLKTGTLIMLVFIVSLIMMWILIEPNSINNLKLGLSFIILGVPVYFLLKVYYDPDAIIKINDAIAYITLLMESLILPKGIIKEILTLLGDIKGKKILEFGCSVGTFTLPLAEAVNPNGKVYATDLSKKGILITSSRINKKGHSHVIVIHDEHQINRVHPLIPDVNAIVSIGMMGYLQDVKKVLNEMSSLLPYGGKIVFVDYVDLFKIIPNVAWLSKDKTIEKVFREAGFSVSVIRKKGLFWNYVYVYGIKSREDIPYV